MERINLQFFGGRGASSGAGVGGNITSAYSVTGANGEKINWYFSKDGSTNFYSDSINGMPQPTPNNWTPAEMIERVKSNGGEVEKKSKSALKKEVDNYKREREETDNLLNQAYVQDADMKRGSRSNRINRRVNRRR